MEEISPVRVKGTRKADLNRVRGLQGTRDYRQGPRTKTSNRNQWHEPLEK